MPRNALGLPGCGGCANQRPMSALDLGFLTQSALTVAREAGALVLAGYRSRPTVDRKASYADLVTEFDLASERLIRRRFGELTPDVPVVGEEEGGRIGDGPTWVCDPIDGTVNFASGHPFFAISLGLLQGGVPLLGVVLAPALQVEWHGALGSGAFRNGQPCAVSGNASLADALVATGISPVMRRHGHPEDNLAAFTRVTPEVRDIRRCGSAALDLCLVADGTYDAYWERRLAAWDVAAGAALVLAAGGRLTNLLGGPYDLAEGYILASNGHVHDALLDLVRIDGMPPRDGATPGGNG
jgi:myo-inositol-1(or 4)-monophosphatase